MNDTMFISSVETTDENVILIPNQEVKTLTNVTCYKIIIACNVEATANLPVLIRTAIGDIPVLCKFANTLYANQLNKRMMYRIGFGTGNDNYPEGHFIIFSNVKPRAEATEPAPSI